MKNRPIIVVRALAKDSEGRVLVGRRSSKSGNSLYSLFGGKADAGESLEDALKREIKEETNLRVENAKLLSESFDEVDGKIWHVYYYSCGIIDIGELCLNLDEHSAVAFITQENMWEYEFAFGHDQLLSIYFDEISKELRLGGFN